MGRPRKQTVEFFPHFVASDKTKDILHDKWGNDGYAVWYKLLELLGRSEGHCYNCSKIIDKDYLVSLMKAPEETVMGIINTLVEIEKIDKELWEKKKIIWCQDFVDSLQDVYFKRTVSIPEKPIIEDFTEEKLQKSEIIETEKKQERKPESKKKTEVKKVKYAEYVSMTEKEYEKLVETHGKEKTKRMIEKLDNYKGSSGKTYRSDYRAILNWVVDEVNAECAKKEGKSKDDTYFGGFDPAAFRPSTGFHREN